jgi:hypothetical protein
VVWEIVNCEKNLMWKKGWVRMMRMRENVKMSDGRYERRVKCMVLCEGGKIR